MDVDEEDKDRIESDPEHGLQPFRREGLATVSKCTEVTALHCDEVDHVEARA